MKKITLLIILTYGFTFSSHATTFGYVTGKINKVLAGRDNFYGTRFYLNSTSDTTAGICNSVFIYMERELNSGFDTKLSIFLSAYMADKDVKFTVEVGRNGYNKLIEGFME